jgi:hypothetical protein
LVFVLVGIVRYWYGYWWVLGGIGIGGIGIGIGTGIGTGIV